MQNGGIVPPMIPPRQHPVAPSAASRPTTATALLRVAALAGMTTALVAAPALAHKQKEPAPAPAGAVMQISADTVRDDQWQVDRLKGRKAWSVSTGSEVIVAVIDSGVSGDHPDLSGQVLSGIDLVDEGGDGTADAVGHGTTVAGLIAGRGDDDEGVVGLAPDAKILPVRVLDAKNMYNDAKVVAKGLVWAVDHGAQVVNLSLGSGQVDPSLAEAIDYAFARDVVVVACVGNVIPNGPAGVWHPASEPGVIAVTALTPNGDLWRRSVTGPQTVLAAPGSNLVGARPGGGYQRVQGTSYAAPLVAATAALLRSKFPEMSAANVVQRLIMTADDEGDPGRDDQYGFGVVDPYGALTSSVPEAITNPLDNTPPPGKSGFGLALPEETPFTEPAAPPGTAEPARPMRPKQGVATSVLPAPDSGPVPNRGEPFGLATALAGFTVLASGLTVARRA